MQTNEEPNSVTKKSSMHAIYESWPDHFKAASEIECKADLDSNIYKNILLCGMGGSATSCDIIADVMNNSGNIPAIVVRGGDIPSFVDKYSLVIINSASGNTLETIRMMEQACEKNAEVISISSGGLLQEKSNYYGQKHITIPSLKLPRASLPYLLMPALKLIDPFLKRSVKEEINSFHKDLQIVKEKIASEIPEEYNISKKISHFLRNGFAFCFTSPDLLTVGTRFKNSLNENAKVHCLRDSVLEASHNEIVPFTFNWNFESKVLLLCWQSDNLLTQDRFKRIGSFFREVGQPFMEISMPGENLLRSTVSAIYILDYASIYMANGRNLDPSPTPAIDLLKR